MIRHDHRHHTRYTVLACLYVVDHTLVRLSRRLAEADAWRDSHKIQLPAYRDLTIERINGCLDERLRLMRLRDRLREDEERATRFPTNHTQITVN